MICICSCCSVEFETTESRVKRTQSHGNAVTCSRSCASKLMHLRLKETPKPIVKKQCCVCGDIFDSRGSSYWCDKCFDGRYYGKQFVNGSWTLKPRSYKYDVVEGFFKLWSPEMAYALGFIAADGCICKGKFSYQFSVMSTDEDIIVKLSNLFGDSPVRCHTRIPPRKPIYKVISTNQRFIKPLLDLGVVPGKSKVMQGFNVPDEYFSDFLRGFTDGDGSITTCNGIYPAVKWVGASKDFMFWLHQKIQSVLGISLKLQEDIRGPYWTLELVGSSARKTLEYLNYKDSSISMDRKRILAEKWLSE